ncbi:MAG: CAP domain-containing protein [Nocardioidaceae bacterium]
MTKPPRARCGTPGSFTRTAGLPRLAVLVAAIALLCFVAPSQALAQREAADPLTHTSSAATDSASPATDSARVLMATPSSAAAAVGPMTLSTTSYNQRLLRWVNQARGVHGLPAVRAATCLGGFAERWARYLARSNLLYHQDLQRILAECQLSSTGEVLAKGAISPRRMVRSWLRSPEHRAILLTRAYRIAGVGSGIDAGDVIGCIDFGRH